MKIATARKKTSKRWRTQEITWSAFLDRLREPLRTAETAREYRGMSKADRDAAKEAAGGFVAGALSSGQRKTEFVTERSMLTLDADRAKPGAWGRVSALVEYRMCCYTTHSHTEAEPRLRWIIPTSRPMTPDEYPAVARTVATWLDIETMDPSTYEIARLMYWPSCSKDGPYEFHEQDGPVLNPDDVLALYGPGDAWKDTSLWPISRAEKEVRQTLIAKAGEPTQKPGIVGLFCRTWDIPSAIAEFLPDIYTETNLPGRYTYAAGSTAGGAVVYNDGAFLYSNHATDPAAGRSVNAFDLVRIHKYGQLDDEDERDTPVTKLKSYEAMSRWAAELPEVKEQMAAERQAEADTDFSDMLSTDPVEEAEGDDEPEEDTSWTKKLTLRPKSSECEPTVNNVRLILANDKRLRGRVCYNAFTLRRCARDPLPWTPGREGLRSWEDSDDAGLRWYLEKVWGISNRGVIADAEELTARETSVHPVREYLSGLVWDGIPRAETLLIDYLGADNTPLNREIAKRWLLAAVSRVLRPGCKFDTILVLVSPEQGIGKSQLADILAGEWFQDGLPQIGSKDSMQALRGAWIVEVNEMAATKKVEDEAIKQFFAARNDRYRESYGRYEADHPRQCVFIGSTNTREFIVDNTGGRRFWPVDVHARAADVGPRMDALRCVRDQIWAEVMAMYKAGDTSLWFSEPQYLSELTERQTQHTQEDEWLGWVQSFLDRPLPDEWDALTPEDRRAVMRGDDLRYPPEVRAKWTRRREEVTIAEIRNELLCEDLARGAGGSNPSSRHLGRVLNVLPGWKLTNRKTAPSWVYGRQKIYVRFQPDLAAWAE
jgi:predicted P-loop ATPase